MKKVFSVLLVAALGGIGAAWGENYVVKSPDGRTEMNLSVDAGVSYSVSYNGAVVVEPSRIGLVIDTGKGEVSTQGMKSKRERRRSVDQTIEAPIYIKSEVSDAFNELTLSFGSGISLIARAYNTGVAWRWTVTRSKDFVIKSEQAEFAFAADAKTHIAYLNSNGTLEEQVMASYENVYETLPYGDLNPERLAMVPFAVETKSGAVCAVTESDVEGYPNMNLNKPQGEPLAAYFARYPKTEQQGGYKNGELKVPEREDYIARGAAGGKQLPWRVINTVEKAQQLLEQDLVYCLASESRIGDASWVKPGMVAWDWWCDWGLTGQSFTPGVNTETYKVYIDFAQKYGIPYIIIDDGWEENGPADLFQIVDGIDIREVVDYGRERGVGVILWATLYSVLRDVDNVFSHYSELGVKGFKIDFIDRDDALMVEHLYEIAEVAARYKLLIDYHGVYKPAGMGRTYPNVLNFEGVSGMEQNKWASIAQHDQVSYDVMIPYLRMLAGPLDYTQGAMLNGTRHTYHASWSEPMSQGTRARQLALYVVLFSPLNMLCDSPSLYEQNPECTELIASIPCVWDETVALEGAIGERVAVARRSGSTWYVGVLNGWNAETLELDLSQIGAGGKTAEVYEDGPLAGKRATDYRHRSVTLPADGKVEVRLANGGGCVLVFSD